MDGNEHGWWEIGDDFLVNIVVAGLSPYEVDAVGNYIMGHDPKEIWYTRVAKEKSYGECDPNKIKIYWIRDNGDIEPVKNLAEIKRYPIGLPSLSKGGCWKQGRIDESGRERHHPPQHRHARGDPHNRFESFL